MRIIAGSARGLPLKAPPTRATRPTSDRVRESLFGLIESSAANWDAVLDLYAGSGALGIEALSRGAGWADFVESQRAACAAIRENLSRARLADRARVICRPVDRALPELNRRYDIILLDPPYADAQRDAILARLARSPLLTGQSLVVVEHSRHHPVIEAYPPLHLTKQRRYGDTLISIFEQGESS
ncbi:MAG TPA: 16S rRNA (guanine(966)-N(2))-methyltransferase RsmD [Dehalococcoidia bacterium]|nr:16S rRNA (guanine(966)-N(2))-methyltransferase RsmD [Dehalococcoidia bacterium]